MVSVLMHKFPFGLVSFNLRFSWSMEYIWYTDERDDCKDLIHAVKLLRGCDNHFGKCWVQRKFTHLLSNWSQISLVIKSSKIVELLKRPHKSLGGRRVHVIKMNDVIDSKFKKS